MDKGEIYKELSMPYDALCNYLVDKYGAAKYDYYTSPECTTKNKLVFRVKEGLFCHHRDEDKGEDLSHEHMAKMQPFDWQRKERLVYCNILEHLILHIKIAVMRQKCFMKKPNDVGTFFTRGLFMICQDINDMFLYTDTRAAKYKAGYKVIKDNYEDYIVLINAALKYVENNYIGDDKTAPAFLRPGAVIHCSLGDGEILDYTEDGERFIIKTASGETCEWSVICAYDQLTFRDYVEITIENFSTGEYDSNDKIYDDITNCKNADKIEEWAELLKNDFIGYGYKQYASIELSEDFGSKNADQYISKALPMYSETTINLDGKLPIFWKGPEIPIKAYNSFYIVRLETMFDIKGVQKPFVRYREHDPIRRVGGMHNESKNRINSGYTVLDTSDYTDYGGKVNHAAVILTLGKDDFELFKERYYIDYLKVLDGCYFT